MTTWPQNAFVGQRVVCIVDDWNSDQSRRLIEAHPTFKFAKKGIVYTIREVVPNITRDGLGLRLVEIVNPTLGTSVGPFEPTFQIEAFRPVDETKIDVFRRIAANPPKILTTA